MKKFLLAVLLTLVSVVAAQAQKRTFTDVFQAKLSGGITMPFTNPSCTRVGLNSSEQSFLYNIVNDDFDITLSFKTDDHMSVGVGYEASGQCTKSQLLTRPADPPISGIDPEHWDIDQKYPYRYGTYNLIYAQLNYSIFNWYRKADWRPVVYFRIGACQKTDYVKESAVVASSVTDGISASNSWCVQTGLGVMLHKRIWKDLSAYLDVRESSFIISSSQKVNGYYRSLENEKEILYHSGKITGWFSANLGLSWNF